MGTTENLAELSTVIHSFPQACGQLGGLRPHRLSFQERRPGRVSGQFLLRLALPDAASACQVGDDIHRLPWFVHNCYITPRRAVNPAVLRRRGHGAGGPA